MKIFNMGGQEIFLVFLIMFIFLGPGRMRNAAKKIARLIRGIVRSETWNQMSVIYNEIRYIPEEIMKEVDFEDLKKEVRDELTDIRKDVHHELTQASSELNSIVNDSQQKVIDIEQVLSVECSEEAQEPIHKIETSMDK